MTVVLPALAASLAKDVYLVQDSRDAVVFLARKEFSKDNKMVMKASVGCRILRATRDAFAVCAVGGDSHRNEIFLVFRGTAWTNNHLPSTLPLISGGSHGMKSYIESVINKGWEALKNTRQNTYTIEAGIEHW